MSKGDLSRDDTKKMLKTVSEGEIRVDTDEYSIYEEGNRGENVKEHRFVNHSKEYANDGCACEQSIILFPMA